MLDISVVVCTFNRATLLRQAVESVAAQETGGRFHYEVVVVDNGSTDNTAEVVAGLAGAARVPVRLVREPTPGVAAARNRGVAESRGAWIAFFDDDQVADPRWLAELLALAQETGAQCVGGAVDLLLPPGVERQLPLVCRRVLGATGAISRPRPYDRKVMPGTGNVMIHGSVFQKVGVFDVTLTQAGEDVDLFRRIRAAGVASWYTPSAIVHHVIPPHRLEDEYFRWASLRVGACFAHRDATEHGRAYLLATLAARLVQAAAIHGPRLAWARVRGDREGALAVRCLLWRFQGFARYAMHVAAPRWAAQSAFLAQINFRKEGQLFGSS
jgi:glycosyltransferase involved in cell wall biosynthesis